MPQIFKALASIMAWGLWIIAWVMGLSVFIMGIISGTLYGEEPSMIFPAFFAVSTACGVSSVVIMLLRKKLE